MHCKSLTDGVFELTLRKEAEGLLIVLFFAEGDPGIGWIKQALEMIGPDIGDNLQTHVCMVDLSKYQMLGKDLRIDSEELPKIVLFLDQKQEYGFSAKDNVGDPLSFHDIREEITDYLKKLGVLS